MIQIKSSSWSSRIDCFNIHYIKKSFEDYLTIIIVTTTWKSNKVKVSIAMLAAERLPIRRSDLALEPNADVTTKRTCVLTIIIINDLHKVGISSVENHLFSRYSIQLHGFLL